MPEQMKNFIILISAIAVVLILIVLFCTSKSKVRKLISMFLNDDSASYKNNAPEPRNKRPAQPEKAKKSSQPQIEMATLVRKCDDRRRIIESTGQTKIEDEFYELVFKSRKGKTIIIECSRNAYNNIPFNQQGSLTYKRDRLIKFKYFGGIIHNDD